MKIDEIISQNRRDFIAIFTCEYCGNKIKMNGYDDSYFHNRVIPRMKCSKCGKSSPESYVPIATKYPEGIQV